MNALFDEIQNRWRALFERLAAGDDAPPAQRLRLEGLMEAAVLTGAADVAELRAAMARVHLEVFAETFAARLGEDWEQAHPFPQIPAFAQCAPVSPAGAD
ncbi:MAG: hypothetical protein ACI87W_003526 [Halieaceae bacterium]|jgi:hypothetical protein